MFKLPVAGYNKKLQKAFREYFDKVVSITADSVFDHLFSRNIASEDDINKWNEFQGKDKMRQMLFTLLSRQHPTSFIELRYIIAKEPVNHWLIEEIDKLCGSIEPSWDELPKAVESDATSKYDSHWHMTVVVKLVITTCRNVKYVDSSSMVRDVTQTPNFG